MDGHSSGFPHPHPPPPPPPPPADHQSGPPPTKRQKVAIACDVCRAKKVKCDGLRPICSPCARRSERGVPCEYTSEVRTSQGPSKGYVHHLELKLRELQAEKGQLPITLPQPQSDLGSSPAVSHLRPFEESWSSPGPGRHDFAVKTSPLRTYSSQLLTNGGRAYPASVPYGASPHHSQLASTPTTGGHRPLLCTKPRARSTYSAALPGAEQAHAHFVGSKNGRPSVYQLRDAVSATVKSTSSAHTSPVFSEVPLPQLPMLQPKVPDAPRIEYVLPPRKVADGLLDVYWTMVHPFYPFLDRRHFQAMYDSIWAGEPCQSDESLMMCSLNVAFALASQLSDSLPPQEREPSARRYFDRAQDLLALDLWDVGSVQLVQCLLLMGRYLQTTHTAHQAWMVTGLTVRIAEGLGLHLPETSLGIENLYQRELVRRVWHGCVLMDRILSMQYSRPTMISKTSSDAVPLPSMRDEDRLTTDQFNGQPSLAAFYVKVLELFRIVVNVAQNSALLSRGAAYFTSGDAYDVFFGDTNVDHVAETLRLDQALSAWASSLPAHLRVGSTDNLPQETVTARRQAHVLRSIYLHARILLFRPILLRFCLASSTAAGSHISSRPAESWAPHDVDSLPDQLSLSCARLALRAAHDVIHHIHSHLDHNTVSGPVSHWWFCLLFVYSAATVLQAARLRGISLHDESTTGAAMDTSWTYALEIVRALEPLSPQAGRCAVALEIIARRVGQAITGPKVTAAAPDTVDPDLAGAATTGDGAGQDEVDLTDMGWLTSAPIDL